MGTDLTFGLGGGGKKKKGPVQIPGAEPEKTAEDIRAESERNAAEELTRAMEESQRQLTEALAQQQAAYEKAQKEAEARAEQYRQDQARIAAYDEIDYLTMGRLEAEETAISDIEEALRFEESEALLRGVDFKVTEEQKEDRVQKAFEEYWGKDSESRLGDLMRSWGSPEQTEEERRKVEAGTSPFAWNPGRQISGFDYSQYTSEVTVTPAEKASISAKSELKPMNKKETKSKAVPPSKPKPKTKLPPGMIPGIVPFDENLLSKQISLLGGESTLSLLGD